MRRSKSPSAGFTLVELLVVMGIMGLVLVAVLKEEGTDFLGGKAIDFSLCDFAKKGGLSSSVVPDQRQDLAWIHIEVGAV